MRPRSRRHLRRSIPARAGQPSNGERAFSFATVYPRTRGATTVAGYGVLTNGGLSPHARGNPPGPAPGPDLLRSIPARAGQPCGTRRRFRKAGVYPRTRGATDWATTYEYVISGLSPHARGNPAPGPRAWSTRRSIPARAGQPAMAGSRTARVPVYPRTRGATGTHRLAERFSAGLSPHARGNPTEAPAIHHRHRSIPHARGNRHAVPCARPGQRSIPARAGQPR